MCRLWSSPVFCGLPFHPRYEVAKARYSQRSQYPVVCDLGCKKRRRRFHRYMQNMITKHVEGLIHMNKIITVYNHIYIQYIHANKYTISESNIKSKGRSSYTHFWYDKLLGGSMIGGSCSSATIKRMITKQLISWNQGLHFTCIWVLYWVTNAK